VIAVSAVGFWTMRLSLSIVSQRRLEREPDLPR
jgi:hypothetical protein